MNGLKIVVLGDGAVGKTCMLIRLSTNVFPGEYIPTVCDNFTHRMNIDGFSINIELWDTAEGEAYGRLRPLSYPGTDVFILNFSVVGLSSLENIRAKWYPEIAHHMPRTPFLLVATKTDLREDYETLTKLNERWGRGPIEVHEGMDVANELGAAAYLEISALLGEGITEVFSGGIYPSFSPSSSSHLL